MGSNKKSPMPMGDNGASSPERLMPKALTNAAARFVDSLKINSISEAVRRGRKVVIKRRHGYSEQLTGLANLYFRIAGLPIRFWTEKFQGPWSHGDAGMANVIYDEASNRARLIDFEIVHDKTLPGLSRHADDLLIFLLDLIATAPGRQWMPLTLAFLSAYDNAPV